MQTKVRNFRWGRTAALWAAGALAVCVAGASMASAQQVPMVKASGQSSKVINYWTPERLKSAVPLDALTAKSLSSAKTSAMPAGVAKGKQGVGSPPELEIGDKLSKRLFVPDPIKAGKAAGQKTFGTAGFYHTTSRVFPAGAVNAYPNRAAGKLFFTDPRTGGNFVCSASVIQRRVVVTAGHCVAHGSADSANRYFYGNFLYVPAYRNGVAPFGSWTWSMATTTNNWFGSGSVPNVQDVGMIETQDNVIGANLRRIGTVTGWLGWWTGWGREYPNNITQLGYPCNLDSCGLMQVNHAQGVRIVNNNVEIGSAMQGGSSGGPWIQDHGVAAAGSPAFTAGNWVLGTTSYQYLGNPSPQVLGASIFANAGFAGLGFGDLWNFVCANRPGNCSP